MKRILLSFLMVLLVPLSVQADDNVRATFGAKESNNTYAIEYKKDGIVYFRPQGGVKFAYEKATTNDTITAQETGTTYALAPSSQMTSILPDADVGMTFTFIAVDGNADGTEKFILDPQSADTFRGVVNSGATSTFASGDSVISPGVTGDSITIFCAEDTYWDVVDLRGTFVDNN